MEEVPRHERVAKFAAARLQAMSAFHEPDPKPDSPLPAPLQTGSSARIALRVILKTRLSKCLSYNGRFR